MNVRDTHTLVFVAALFTIAKLWNQPRCPATEEQINVVCAPNRALFGHRKNEIMSFAGKWMEMEIILLSEISQTQKDKCPLFSLMQNLDLKKT
jgi:hypothetical protein